MWSCNRKNNLKNIDNFVVKKHVDQISVLEVSDVFITHCGMNSTHESLYYNVPMVLFPQQSEQKMISKRISTLGAGVILKRNHSNNIKNAVMDVMVPMLQNKMFRIENGEFTNPELGVNENAIDSILNM